MNLQRFGRLNQKNRDWTPKHGMTDQQYLSFSRETHGNHRQTGSLWSYHVFPVHILERLLVWSIATCQLQICYCYSWSPQMCHGPTPSYGQRLSRLPDWVCWGGPCHRGHIGISTPTNPSRGRQAFEFQTILGLGQWKHHIVWSKTSQFVVLKTMLKNCKIQILLVNIFYSCLDLFSPHIHQQRKQIGGHLLRSRQSSRAQPREHKPVERPLMAELLVAKEWWLNLASQRSK